MKNTNNKENMKKIFKMAFAVVAFAAVGLGSYKAYSSYTAANMSEEDLLMAENIEAFSWPSMACDGRKSTCAFTSDWVRIVGKPAAVDKPAPKEEHKKIENP